MKAVAKVFKEQIESNSQQSIECVR